MKWYSVSDVIVVVSVVTGLVLIGMDFAAARVVRAIATSIVIEPTGQGGDKGGGRSGGGGRSDGGGDGEDDGDDDSLANDDNYNADPSGDLWSDSSGNKHLRRPDRNGGLWADRLEC